MRSRNIKRVLVVLCLVLYMANPLLATAKLVPGSVAQAAGKVVKLNKTSATIYNSKSLQLKLLNATGKVVWKSSNKAVASVTGKGKVTGLKPGSVKITATNGGKKYTCKVTVKSVLAVKKKNVEIKTGKRTAVDFWFYIDGNFRWEVANPKLLLCDWSGKWTEGGNRAKLYLTGLKAGSTTVKLTNDKTKDTVVIKVRVTGKTVSPISSNKSYVELEVGEFETINISSLDGGAMTFYISNEDVIDCQWADWIDNVSPLTIYGKEGGESILTITHDETGRSIKVRVFVDDPTVYD